MQKTPAANAKLTHSRDSFANRNPYAHTTSSRERPCIQAQLVILHWPDQIGCGVNYSLIWGPIMMIRLFEFGLLFFAIRKTWCEHHLWMIVVAVGALFRRWMNDAVLATATAKPKTAGLGRPRRAALSLAALALERKHWRAARAASNRLVPVIRFRRRPPL